MIKKLLIIFTFTLTLLFIHLVSGKANSGPVRIYQLPAYSAYSIKETNIQVTKEDLTFNISSTNDASITANYEMKNTSKEQEVVTMAFVSPQSNDVIVKENGTDLPHYSRYLFNTDIYRFRTSGNTLQSCIDQLNVEKNSNLDEKQITLYKITANSSQEQTLELSFQGEYGAIIISQNPYYYYQNDENLIKFSGYFKDYYIIDLNKNLHIKVDKNDITPLENTTLKSGFMKGVSDVFSELIQTETPEEVYYQFITTNSSFIYNVFFIDDSYFTNYIELTFYDVTFNGDETKNLSVNYHYAPGMKKTVRNDYTYLYDYLLSPAENWKDFSNLTINFKLNDRNQYIISSSLPLTYDKETKTYSAYFEKLPDQDLSFSTYHKNELPKYDIHAFMDDAFPVLIILFMLISPIIIILFLVLIIVIAYKKFNKPRY